MMQRIKQTLMAFALVFGLGLVLVPATNVGAVDALGDACTANPDSVLCKNKGDQAGDVVKTVVNVLLYVIGVISVLMIIIGGIMYATSAGEAGRIKTAKDTILYAIVGLAVAFFAFAIVNWVLTLF
ncbi:MAG: TrbC/VirB2 family protein [Candidatus Microsaccharimonas sp.]